MSNRSPKRPIISPDVRDWESVGDPAYLLHDIKELKIHRGATGLGTLAYLLELACIEARREVMPKKEADQGDAG